MKHDKVGSVMTGDVVRAVYDTPFKEVARLLADHGISGLPVVDEDDKVIGVISETDLMMRRAAPPDPYEYEHPRRLRLTAPTRGARRQAAKAEARTAGRLMKSGRCWSAPCGRRPTASTSPSRRESSPSPATGSAGARRSSSSR